jgi:hypothetical protein
VENGQNIFPQVPIHSGLWKTDFPQWKSFPQREKQHPKQLYGFSTYAQALLLLLSFVSKKE